LRKPLLDPGKESLGADTLASEHAVEVRAADTNSPDVVLLYEPGDGAGVQ
jgi:hypothetical protein